MSWLYDLENHRACDEDADLVLVKQGFGRDNFKYSIRNLRDKSFCFSFEAIPKGPTRELTKSEKQKWPTFDEVTPWSVVAKNLTAKQMEIISEALRSLTNSRENGYSRIVESVGRRSMVEINYVNRLEGR